MVNSMAIARDIIIQGDTVLYRARQEAVDAGAQAKRAERALEVAHTERAEALQEAKRQAVAELEHARTVEARQKEMEARWRETKAELNSCELRLHTITLLVRGVEEWAKNAEEIARMVDARVADAAIDRHMALQRASEMEATTRATKEKAAMAERAAAEAIERYRGSDTFVDELAEALVKIYLQGFRVCKEKAVRLFSILGLNDLEPDGNEEPEVSPIVQRLTDDVPAPIDT